MSRDFSHLDAFKRENLPTPKSCPCCGESRPVGLGVDESLIGLDVGIQECCTYGIRCLGCGLKMHREFPDTKADEHMNTTQEEYEVVVLIWALEAWNRRAE